MAPLPFSNEIQTILDRIKNLEHEGVNEGVKENNVNSATSVIFKFHWLKSYMDDSVYEISEKAYELIPWTARFNVEEVATHCADQSFHLDLHDAGLIIILWEVPHTWRGIPEKTKRVMERFMSFNVERAFKLRDFQYDVFHHPMYFAKGFGFDTAENAFLAALQGLYRQCCSEIPRYRQIGNWEHLYLRRVQIKLFKDRLRTVFTQLKLDSLSTNKACKLLFDLESSFEFQCINSVLIDKILWELSDEI